MDFFSVDNKIKFDEYGEEIYTKDDNEDLFEEELCQAIMDSCAFNKKQSQGIYNEAYREAHSHGLTAIVSVARDYAEFIREIMNLEDKK